MKKKTPFLHILFTFFWYNKFDLAERVLKNKYAILIFLLFAKKEII